MNDDHSDERAAEQVFDYFLHELISGQSPPDLSQRIAEAWSREQAQTTDSANRLRSARADSGNQTAPSARAHPPSPAPETAAPGNLQPVRARPLRAPSTIAGSGDTSGLGRADQPILARPIHASGPPRARLKRSRRPPR